LTHHYDCPSAAFSVCYFSTSCFLSFGWVFFEPSLLISFFIPLDFLFVFFSSLPHYCPLVRSLPLLSSALFWFSYFFFSPIITLYSLTYFDFFFDPRVSRLPRLLRVPVRSIFPPLGGVAPAHPWGAFFSASFLSAAPPFRALYSFTHSPIHAFYPVFLALPLLSFRPPLLMVSIFFLFTLVNCPCLSAFFIFLHAALFALGSILLLCWAALHLYFVFLFCSYCSVGSFLPSALHVTCFIVPLCPYRGWAPYPAFLLLPSYLFSAHSCPFF